MVQDVWFYLAVHYVCLTLALSLVCASLEAFIGHFFWMVYYIHISIAWFIMFFFLSSRLHYVYSFFVVVLFVYVFTHCVFTCTAHYDNSFKWIDTRDFWTENTTISPRTLNCCLRKCLVRELIRMYMQEQVQKGIHEKHIMNHAREKHTLWPKLERETHHEPR